MVEETDTKAVRLYSSNFGFAQGSRGSQRHNHWHDGHKTLLIITKGVFLAITANQSLPSTRKILARGLLEQKPGIQFKKNIQCLFKEPQLFALSKFPPQHPQPLHPSSLTASTDDLAWRNVPRHPQPPHPRRNVPRPADWTNECY